MIEEDSRVSLDILIILAITLSTHLLTHKKTVHRQFFSSASIFLSSDVESDVL